ncbi:MAG: Acetyl-CoA decarbonylase/synthase complex subunit beta 2 [Methanonatronarchaeales archaeon]|nr:Acetyl-CoA decarbonylase/synthase complex subunit beta 2 [Methanonatronarchaeales archaeon]
MYPMALVPGDDDKGFQLVSVEEWVTDGHQLVGPDVEHLGEGAPFGLLVEVAGEPPEEPQALVGQALNSVEGVRYSGDGHRVELRLEREAPALAELSGLLHDVLVTGPGVEAVRVEIYTEPRRVEELVGRSRVSGEVAGSRVRDADVEVFYGCRMCQSASPGHVCVIAPERPGNCGIGWEEARASFTVNPEGGYFKVDADGSTDEGRSVVEGLEEETGGRTSRVRLYDLMKDPHPTCGCVCFDVVVFYVPELDGFGLVDASYGGVTPLGLTFEELAGRFEAGASVPGLQGVSWEYLCSESFLRDSGGWEGLVWVTDAVRRALGGAVDEEQLASVPGENLLDLDAVAAAVERREPGR